MLHIVFLILKIILFLILAVLGLLLAIALAVLLVPIRYRAEASLHGEIHARGLFHTKTAPRGTRRD